MSESIKSLISKQAQGRGPIDPPGVGYVTEKLYMLLQLYLQNKGFNPSAELLQCFAELKDSPMLPNAAYLQVLASRLALDGQGRLVLRDSGKIVLPFEHFANAVMLKHMSGPHGLHLSLEATMRAVIDSYSIGRDNFGMEKEFILEVVNSCPNPACRYYKSHLIEGGPASANNSPVVGGNSNSAANLSLEMATDLAKSSQLLKQQQQQQLKGQQQHHLTNVLMQQNRALAAQQSLEKFNNLSTVEKQRMLAAMCPPNSAPGNSTGNPLSRGGEQQRRQQQEQLLQKQMLMNLSSHANSLDPHVMKINEYMSRNAAEAGSGSGSNTPSLESMTNKDLLALHNGAWTNSVQGSGNNSCSVGEYRDGMFVGQDKIVRVFAELMRNIAKMKTFIRPAMCKPYGKQSESLQKSLMDTIQMVQSLRNCLPASHIPVNSWKSEDRQFRPEGGTFDGC